jgi:ligand-binding sensor domain-containing protein/signal transduction histidine kinase/CheY-like chemotaxis protein
MKITKNILLLLFIATLKVSFVFATDPAIRLKNLSIEDGLPQNSALSVLQDSQGFLWVGTQDGLARYDGYNFKVFKYNEDDPNSLSANFVWVIFEDSHENLWFGTDDGLNRFNPKTEKFSHYHLDASNPNTLANNNVNAITEDRQGKLWVGTNGGISSLNPKTAQFNHYRFDANNPNSLSNNHVKSIVIDRNEVLWVGTYGGGLNRFNPKTQQFSHYRFDVSNPNSLSDDNVQIIMEDQQGILWLGTESGGLNRFNPKSEQFKHYRSDNSTSNSLSNDNVWTIVESHQGNLWLGTYAGGLNRFNPKTEQFTHYSFDPNKPSSLSSDNVYSIFDDLQGTLWVGTGGGGLNRFNLKTEEFGHYHFDANNPNSLNDDHIWAITEDHQGDLWLGTEGGGLNRFNPKTKKFSHYRFDANNPNSLSNDKVMAVIADQQGKLWLGTSGGGLNAYNPKTEQFSHYRFDASTPNSLSNDYVWTLAEDRQGIIWAGTWGAGLNRFDPKTEKFSHYRFDANTSNSLSDDVVLVITEDRHGTLWLGTNGGGLNRFTPDTEQFSHYRFDARNSNSLSDDTVYTIVEDQQGTLWVGTSKGLNRMDSQSGEFKRFTEKDGLPNNIIYRIEEDNDGLLWLSTNQGLSQFNPKTESFKNYEVGDGLQSNEFNSGASFKSKSGELFFGGIKGFNRFFPDKITDDKQKPVVVFTDMLLFNQSVPISSSQVHSENTTQLSTSLFTLQHAINATDSLTLTHQENLVSFEFSALNYSNPEKNKFAYRLEGFDTHWVNTDFKKRFATYTNLPSGDYVLRVKASNSHGVWNEEGATLSITVLPPPWKSWWAYTFYALVIFGLLYWFTQSQQNKKKHLKMLVLERTKELEQHRDNLEELVKKRTQDLVRSQKESMTIHEQLRRSQKMEAIGQLAGGIAHDFNNLLGIIMGNLDLLKMGMGSDEKALNRIDSALKGASRGAEITKKLLGFSRVNAYGASLTSVNLFIENIEELLRKSLTVAINIENHLAFDLWPVNVDVGDLEDAILNLALNARDALLGAGSLVIETSNKVLDEDFVRLNPEGKIGEYVMLSFSDSGIGMTPEVKERVLDPFYTTKAEGKGSGLGLSMVYGFVKRSNGFITIDSELGEGTSIKIFLPRGGEVEQVEAYTIDEEELPVGSETILVVDDEKELVELAVANLESLGYKTLTAFDGKSALNIIKDNPKINLLFCDVIMPGAMNGYQLAMASKRVRPALKTLLTSGFSKNKEDCFSSEDPVITKLKSELLRKPYSQAELVKAVRIVLDEVN